MLKEIHKHELQYGKNKLNLTAFSKILTAVNQAGKIVLYEEHSVKTRKNGITEDREALVVFTGEEFDPLYHKHVSTLEILGLVYHIYVDLS